MYENIGCILSGILQADALDDTGGRADRHTRVKSTVEELSRMRAMLSEQQAEMRTMKEAQLAEMRTMKQELQAMKQKHHDEIEALRQKLLLKNAKSVTQKQAEAKDDASQQLELKQLQAGACVTSHYNIKR